MIKKNKSKTKTNVSILGLFLAFAIMMYVSAMLGLLLLTILIIWNVYTSRYAFDAIKGNKAYSRKDYTSAIYYYSRAISCKTVPSSIIRGYVIIQLKYGNPKEALDTLSSILSERQFSDSDLVTLRVSKALILWKIGNSNDAFDILHELLESEPDIYIYETLSSLLLIHNRIDEALILLDQASDFDNNSNIIKSNLAEANFKTNNYKISEEIFEELINTNIQFIEPYYFYSKILISKGEIEKALLLLEKALNTNDSLLTTVTKDDVQELLNSVNVVN